MTQKHCYLKKKAQKRFFVLSQYLPNPERPEGTVLICRNMVSSVTNFVARELLPRCLGLLVNRDAELNTREGVWGY